MKHILLLVLLVFWNYATSQQRMAVLPKAMNYVKKGNALKTLCIDFFRSTPLPGDKYGSIIHCADSDKKLRQIKKLGKRFEVDGLDRVDEMNLKMKKSGEIISISNNETFVIGTENEEISKGYLAFIESKIQEYNTPNFNNVKHEELQHEIWQYNILDVLGYVKQQNNPIQDYGLAKKRFEADYSNIKGTNILGDEIEYDFIHKLLLVSSDIQSLDIINGLKNTDYRTIYFKKKNESDQYRVYIGARSPIYVGPNDDNMLKVISTYVQNSDKAYFWLESFSNEQQFLLKIDEYLKKEKKTSIAQNLKDFDSDFQSSLKIIGGEKYMEQKIIKDYHLSPNSVKVEVVDNEVTKVHFQKSDDMAKYINDNDLCYASVCINNDGLSISLTCGFSTIEISTSGELVLSLSDEDFSLNISNLSQEECSISGSICLGRDISSEISVQCGEENYSISGGKSYTLMTPNNFVLFGY